jgi:hypothetical protein
MVEKLCAILKDKNYLLIKARGDSMHPFIQDKDIVEIVNIISNKVRLGDIVLYESKIGLCLHRTVFVCNSFFIIKADANFDIEYLKDKSKIIGKVNKIRNSNHTMDMHTMRKVNLSIAIISISHFAFIKIMYPFILIRTKLKLIFPFKIPIFNRNTILKIVNKFMINTYDKYRYK